MKDVDPQGATVADRDDDDDSLLREVAAAPPVAVPADLATLVMLERGVVVDDVFRIEERLGAGGMGVVYAARDLTLEREVALKLMRLDRAATGAGNRLPEVFEREARATARLNHPNIVTLHQFGRWRGLLYLVLERLRGETLAARLERGGVSLSEGLAIIEQVARALIHTHAAGITHRDLKPSNVFLLATGVVKVLDFGVSGLGRAPVDADAAVDPAGQRSTLSLAGTPGYMAPEQWTGDVQDASTDVFAVGVMLYQIVTGRLPFGTAAIDERAIAPSVEARIPVGAAGLAVLIARCLAPRTERLASATELAGELHAIRGVLDDPGGSVASAPGLATARIHPRDRRGRVAIAAVVAGGAMLGAMSGGVPDRAAMCDDGAVRLAGVWDGPTRTRVGAAVRAAAPGADATWAEVERILDVYAAEYVALRATACRNRSGPAEACLDDRIDSLRRLVAVLPTFEPGLALTTATALPDLADCVDPGVVAGGVDPSRSPLRDPGGVVPLAFTVAGPSDEMIHGATFVDGELALVGHASARARMFGEELALGPSAYRTGFVARVGTDGTERWRRVLTGARPLVAASGRAGQLVVAGTYTATAEIGGQTVEVPAGRSETDCFVASLDPADGTARWIRTCGASVASAARGVTADADGNIYLTGEFTGRARFGGAIEHNAAALPRAAPFIASWTAGGELRWVTAARGTSGARSWAIAATTEAVVAASWVTGAGQLGDRALRTGGCVIARLDRDTGAIVWLVEDAGEAGRCAVYAVAIRGDRVGVVGTAAVQAGGAWIGELDLAHGSTVWRRTFSTGNQQIPKTLAYAPDGTLTTAGSYYSSTVAIDAVTLTGNMYEAIVLRFAPGGACVGGLGFGGAHNDMPRWLGYSPDGRLFVAGRFQATLRIGPRAIRSHGGTDGFLFELAPTLAPTLAPP